jgi:hypothetical protein
MNVSTFRPLAAWVPIAMSLAAVVTVLLQIATFGIAPQGDEAAMLISGNFSWLDKSQS